jgi:hypothetical protein
MRSSTKSTRPIILGLAAAAGLAAGVYATWAGLSWVRFGRAPQPTLRDRDALLDLFMPVYDVVERHRIAVAAPAALTLDAAKNQNLLQAPVVRAIFKARELVLRATPADDTAPTGLLSQVLAIGWAVLAEEPGREVVVGAVTKPWEANVVFRPLPPDAFMAFAEPGFVKIAWTLRVDPIDERRSIFRTETRAIATDEEARFRFRRYWAFVSPGVSTIRMLSLRPLKHEAERRAAGHASP